MERIGEYITDPKTLREARKANCLFDSAQDNYGMSLQLIGMSAVSRPEIGLFINVFAEAYASQAQEQADEFNKMTGESVPLRRDDVMDLKNFVLEAVLSRVNT
jgi:hypothetical protein